MGQISFITAFLAGLASFLSPCVLPLVPGYISFISGMSLEELSKGMDRREVMRRAGLGAIFFSAGFTVVFVLVGASATAIGSILHAYAFRKLAGIFIIIFGLHTTGLVPIPWLYYEKRMSFGAFSPGFLGAFLMGFAFAFGWTPCLGPILSSILLLAAAQKTLYQGMALLLVYSIGLGVPFVLTGFGIETFLTFFKKYKRFIRVGEVCAGVLLICIGVLMFRNQLTILTRFFPQFLYKFAM